MARNMGKKPVAEEPTVDGAALDALFRRQSKARVVAERLMTGRPQTRAALVEGLDLSMTTVPRVVEALETAGIQVERTTDRTRQAIYKVVGSSQDVADREHGKVVSRYEHASGEQLSIRITKVEVVDGAVWIEFVADVTGGSYRARIAGSSESLNIPTSMLSGSASVLGVVVFSDGTVGWRVGDDRTSVLLASAQSIV